MTLFNPFFEQNHFFKCTHLIAESGLKLELIQDYLHTCELMPVNPEEVKTSISTTLLSYSPTPNKVIRITHNLANIRFSSESVIRLVEFFKLTGDNNTLSFDRNTAQFQLNKNWFKAGKFFKLLNPAISDKYLSTLVKEYVQANKPPVITLNTMTASEYYSSSTGPYSCMTNKYWDNGEAKTALWDILQVPVLVMKENDRITARALLYKNQFYGRIYSFDNTTEALFKTAVVDAGYEPITSNSEVHYIIPDTYLDKIPYLDNLVQIGNELKTTDRVEHIVIPEEAYELDAIVLIGTAPVKHFTHTIKALTTTSIQIDHITINLVGIVELRALLGILSMQPTADTASAEQINQWLCEIPTLDGWNLIVLDDTILISNEFITLGGCTSIKTKQNIINILDNTLI